MQRLAGVDVWVFLCDLLITFRVAAVPGACRARAGLGYIRACPYAGLGSAQGLAPRLLFAPLVGPPPPARAVRVPGWWLRGRAPLPVRAAPEVCRRRCPYHRQALNEATY